MIDSPCHLRNWIGIAISITITNSPSPPQNHHGSDHPPHHHHHHHHYHLHHHHHQTTMALTLYMADHLSVRTASKSAPGTGLRACCPGRCVLYTSPPTEKNSSLCRLDACFHSTGAMSRPSNVRSVGRDPPANATTVGKIS